jgi:hypothetical protein
MHGIRHHCCKFHLGDRSDGPPGTYGGSDRRLLARPLATCALPLIWGAINSRPKCHTDH